MIRLGSLPGKRIELGASKTNEKFPAESQTLLQVDDMAWLAGASQKSSADTIAGVFVRETPLTLETFVLLLERDLIRDSVRARH
jgi:hypothetical protein